jgi:hypothetical protein
MENNLKPFNLQDALAGKPVVTRQGKKVTQLHLFNTNTEQPLLGIIEGDKDIYTWNKDGIYFSHKDTSAFDLFMAPEKKSIWVNLYEYENGQLWVGCYYNSLEEASKPGTHMGRYIKTIEITNEP